MPEWRRIKKMLKGLGEKFKKQTAREWKLLFRSDPAENPQELAAGKTTLFVYGAGSIKKNGFYNDVKNAIEKGGGKSQ